MGAGSSTEQRSPEQPEAGSGSPAEPEPSGGSPAAEAEAEAEAAAGAPGAPGIAAADPATKLLQKNGQLSTVNAVAEQAELSLQEGALSGQEEEGVVAEVGQRESEDVSEKDSVKEMAANASAVQDIAEDGQEEAPEIIEQIPSSESNLEEQAQPATSQTSDVGFKKVFKFVGFKFTVKKDKSEKSDAVQLLTVRKEEGEVAGGEAEGAGDHLEAGREAADAAPKESELQRSTEKPEETLGPAQSPVELSLQAESGPAPEEGKDGEEKQEKEPTKSPDSPTSPLASETASPFKKFFTQGWAGWRKKTSFRKSKEDELEALEKKKGQEPGRGDAEDKAKAEDAAQPPAASEPPPPEAAGSGQEARLSAEYEKVELPPEGQAQGSPDGKPAPLASEVFDDRVETVAEVHASPAEEGPEGRRAEVGDAAAAWAEAGAEPPACAPGGDPSPPPEPSPDEKAAAARPEGIVGEAEMLAAQERAKVPGSPLKKLFTSSGLKKLSGKKQKGRRGPGEEEEAGAQADSPESADEQRGESSASSPEEPEESGGLERGPADAHPEGEPEEGAASDGEKKREGVTPWASFKKMVTPKKRVRRPSESDKEEEAEKAKSATLSSAESAASEAQEDGAPGEEPRPEEPRRKVDTSVSWEALICVGSSKKRARKASSSDEEGEPRPTAGDGHKPEEAGRDGDAGAEAAPAGRPEHEPGQGGSSPEPAGSPSEGEGVSTWESFKRLVTPRKKSKSKLDEKNEDAAAGAHPSATEAEPGKEESWVSIKKLIPGRRKKRPDGKQDPAAPEDAHEEDSEVPAVVPLSEFEAVEREKLEAQAAPTGEQPAEPKGALVSAELSQSLVRTVAVAVVDGARAVTDMEERSPSWISASAADALGHAEEEAGPPPGGAPGREVRAQVTSVVIHTLPERPGAADDAPAREAELPSEAVTAAGTPGASVAEEAAEASVAEETTDMVSAVSQLSDSADTTEEATPVQEAEGGVPDGEDHERRTHEVLQAVADRVRGEAQPPDARGPGATVPGSAAALALAPAPSMTPRVGARLPGVEEAEEDSPVSEPKGETDGALKGHAGDTETEDLTPERAEEVPRVPESVESSELVTPCGAETVGGVTSEPAPGQAGAPGSAETPADGETAGSTPVAEREAHAGEEAAWGSESQLPGAEAPPAPAERAPQEDKREHPDMQEAPPTDREGPVEAAPLLSKTEVVPGAGQCTEETKGGPLVGGLRVSADTDVAAGQKKVPEGARQDDVTEEAEFQKKDTTELQGHAGSLPAPVERERAAQVEGEEREATPVPASEGLREPEPAEVLSRQRVQTVQVTVIDGKKEVMRLEESSPWPVPEGAVGTDLPAQSSEASLPLTAGAVEKKVLGEAVKLLEAAGTLESADAPLEAEAKPFEPDGVGAQPTAGVPAVPTGAASPAASAPVSVPAAPESGIRAALEADGTTSQGGKPQGDEEQVSSQAVRVSETREGDLKVENEILQLKTESQKLVQNVIQTAVGQLESTENAATDCQIPAPPPTADCQGAEQDIEEEEGGLQASAENETAQEAAALTPGGQTRSESPKVVTAAEEEAVPVEVAGSCVNGQQLEELVLPAQEQRGATGAKSVPGDGDRAGLGGRTEKAPSEPQEDEEGDAVDDPGNQTALEDPEIMGDLTKEPPDANGPKLKEKEVEFQEGKKIETQTPEETQKQEQQPATAELTEP